MPGIWMWEGSEYARVTDGSTYATNVWICLIRPWIYVNRQDSEYVSYNTECHVTLQVNEYLLRDKPIQNLVKDLRLTDLEKQF